MMFATTRLSLILFGLSVMLKYKARRHEAFWQRIKEHHPLRRRAAPEA
jgi:hypothetical protein